MITTILSNYLVAGHTRLKIPLHTGYTTLDGHNHGDWRWGWLRFDKVDNACMALPR